LDLETDMGFWVEDMLFIAIFLSCAGKESKVEVEDIDIELILLVVNE